MTKWKCEDCGAQVELRNRPPYTRHRCGESPPQPGGKRKPASPEQRTADERMADWHQQCSTALRAAGFDPAEGYTTHRMVDGLVLVVPHGAYRATASASAESTSSAPES
jgi:hypothetical protein